MKQLMIMKKLIATITSKSKYIYPKKSLTIITVTTVPCLTLHGTNRISREKQKQGNKEKCIKILTLTANNTKYILYMPRDVIFVFSPTNVQISKDIFYLLPI